MLTRADLAKYPFVAEASEYLRDLGFSIDDVAAPEFSSVIERAEKRLEEALAKGRVSSDLANENTEILSFPVSNLILSLTGEERARRRFALAEAKRAYELLRHESPDKLSYIAASTFKWKVKQTEAQFGKRLFEFCIGISNYLRTSIHLKDPRWKLPNRIVDHGFVYATRDEIARLLEEEVRKRIIDRSVRVPGRIPVFLENEAERTRGLIVKWLGVPSRYELPAVPLPDAMPPCVRHLIDDLADGKNVQHMGRFTLASFLVSIGASDDEIVKAFKPASDFSERMTRYQVEHIGGKRGGRTKYSCPKCETLKTHGVCYKPDQICSTIRNPVVYYKKKASLLRGKETRVGVN